jgi:TonB family protein
MLILVGGAMAQGSTRAYGLGLSRDGHIAFAAAYIAILVTIGAVGVERYAAKLPPFHFSLPGITKSAPPVTFRAHPLPDPAYPHQVNIYPRVAILNRQEGTVVVRLLILTSGEVGDVDVVKSSGYPQLDAAALVATGAWRYLPAMREGAPVSAEINVAIRFKLAG